MSQKSKQDNKEKAETEIEKVSKPEMISSSDISLKNHLKIKNSNKNIEKRRKENADID